MKKLILSLVFIFSLFAMSFSSKKENKEEEGRRCVDVAMEWVNDAVDAGIGDGDLNGEHFDTYIGIYHFYYRECMLGNVY